MQRRVRRQITCRCGAYLFPHRLLGGRCTGKNLVYDYFYSFRRECTECAMNCSGGCQVVDGLEPPWVCPILADDLHRNEIPLTGKARMYFRDATRNSWV